MHFAADRGHNEVVELLLANKADINAKDGVGFAPLHLAAESGHKEVAELLLAKGAKMNGNCSGQKFTTGPQSQNGALVVKLYLAFL